MSVARGKQPNPIQMSREGQAARGEGAYEHIHIILRTFLPFQFHQRVRHYTGGAVRCLLACHPPHNPHSLLGEWGGRQVGVIKEKIHMLNRTGGVTTYYTEAEYKYDTKPNMTGESAKGILSEM